MLYYNEPWLYLFFYMNSKQENPEEMTNDAWPWYFFFVKIFVFQSKLNKVVE